MRHNCPNCRRKLYRLGGVKGKSLNNCHYCGYKEKR